MAEKIQGVADIVFLIDATGSMQPSINDIKANIKAFFRTLQTPDANGAPCVKDWRARVIGYRDAEHDREWLVKNPFVRDVAQVEAQLDALEAKEGGDEPESLLDALYLVAKCGSTDKGAQEQDPEKWRYVSEAARCVVIFTDASYKPKTSIPEAAGLSFEDIKNFIDAEHLRISIYAPQMSCHDDLGSIDAVEYMPIDCDPSKPGDAVAKLREFTADTANFRKTMEQIARSVSASAHAEDL